MSRVFELRGRWRFLPVAITVALLSGVGIPGHTDDSAGTEQANGAATVVEIELHPLQPRQWRLIWTSDPTREATLSWSTREAGSRHVVHLSSADGTSQVVTATHNGAYTSSGDTLFYHHARLENLRPDTRYEVVMESDWQRSPDFYFRTAPREDRPFSILFGGDSRSDPAMRRQVNRLMAELTQRDPQIRCFAHGGDYINTGSSFAQWRQWLTDHEHTVTDGGRLLPIVPTRGNHDIGPLFEEVFGFPAGDTNYYALDLSPQVRLVTLNTEISLAGDQRAWLAEELAASRPRYRFLLAQYHRPAYPAVKRPGAAKQHWVPLFEQHNVDLVCEADGHVIKRTVPIREDKFDPAGVVYIGEGGLGVPQRQPKSERWYLRDSGMSARGHHVHVLTFTGEAIEGRGVGLGGVLLDEFRRARRQRVDSGVGRRNESADR